MNALVTQQEGRAIGAVYSFDEKKQMADCLAQSGLFGVKNPVQALALMLVAEAEGEHPASIAQDYDIIQGKGTRKTHSVLARFQAMGGKVDWHELSHTRAEATFSHPKGGALRLDWTIEQAKQAGLTGKDNWKGYARAMLRARLIAEGVRAVYPAAIGGWQVPEEAMGPQLDAPAPQEKHMGVAEVVQAAGQQQAKQAQQRETYPEDQFKKNLPAWQDVIRKGRKTADQIIAMAETKHPLTEAQKAEIRKAKADAPAAADQPQDVTPKVTFAAVADRIAKALDLDQLADAGTFIGEVAEDQQRRELNAIYETRHNELAGKE